MAGSIAENINRFKTSLSDGVELVAVSKFQPLSSLKEAYEAGQRIFGESRVNELLEKIERMPSDVRWHFIGHLQTNKVKYLIGKVALIESVDSMRLLEIIDRLSSESGIETNVLMQVHVAAEETKFGWDPDELISFFATRQFERFKATRLCGIMGMATNTDDKKRVEADFARIAEVRRSIIQAVPGLSGFDIVSMGMTDDYHLAVRHGSNLVRIGTGIFGSRM